MKHLIVFRLFRAIYFSLNFTQPKASPECVLGKSDAIVACPFGTHSQNETIGLANDAMVDIMASLHKRFKKQMLIAQWEFEDSAKKLPYDLLVGKKWDTHITTRSFLESVRKQFPELEKITVIAHPDHILRVAETARTLDFDPVIPDGISQIPYDRECIVQPWVRYRWKCQGIHPKKWGFMWWEFLLARPFFVLKGWM